MSTTYMGLTWLLFIDAIHIDDDKCPLFYFYKVVRSRQTIAVTERTTRGFVLCLLERLNS